MNARIHEDSFPTVPSRPARDVVDQVNALCMAERQARAKRAQRIAAEPRYLVETGYQLRCTTHFVEFAKALEFLIDHIDDDQEPRLLGAGYDDESTGLTEDERDDVLEAREMRAPKARRV
jgi:hypothetical protein